MKLVDLKTPVDLDDPFTRVFAWPKSWENDPDEVLSAVLDVPDVAAGDPALVPLDHDATAAAVARGQESGYPADRWNVRVYVSLRRPKPEPTTTIAWKGIEIMTPPAV